jgi:spore maturation protein CgeB
LKRILIIGSAHTAALEHIYSKYLSNLGNEVALYPIQDYFLSYYHSNLLNKILFRLGLSKIYKQLQTGVLDYVAVYKPTHILVFKGMELLPSTLLAWKQQQIKLINYNPDNPFVFSGRGSGNKNVTHSIKLFDLYGSYDRTIVKQLEAQGVNSALIPFGFELEDAFYEEICKIKEVNKVCFLGNPDKERAQFIKKLLDLNVAIDIYGTGWHSYFKNHPLVQLFPAVYGNEFWITLRKYAVQLNLMRIHNLNSHNMRSFDIPGIGGIMLAPYTEDHANYFVNQEEVFLFRNSEECLSNIKYLLSLTVEEREKIRNSARIKSIRMYTYAKRVQELNTCLDTL